MEDTPIKVLVVDDDEDVATATSALLECYGFSVEMTTSADTCIDRATSFGPDVVILDLSMPGVDGLRVANALLNHHKPAQAKIIAYTGYSSGSIYEAALSTGFHKILCKPAPAEVLVGAILEVTRGLTAHSSRRC